jgi:hypothetical protein
LEKEQEFDPYIKHASNLYEDWTGASNTLLSILDIRRNTKKNSMDPN